MRRLSRRVIMVNLKSNVTIRIYFLLHEVFERRSKVYSDMVCFSQWEPEIRHHCSDVPLLLVGTKTDLRDMKQDKNNPNKEILSPSEVCHPLVQ